MNMETVNQIELLDKDREVIIKESERIINNIENISLDSEDKELLKAAIQNGLEYAKKINKEKYTPKKYRINNFE